MPCCSGDPLWNGDAAQITVLPRRQRIEECACALGCCGTQQYVLIVAIQLHERVQQLARVPPDACCLDCGRGRVDGDLHRVTGVC